MGPVPEPLSTVDVAVDEDTAIVLRRHGNPDGPRLVLSHGLGLAVDLYYPFWSRLTAQFDLIVYDLRNHGQNPLGPLAAHTLPALARDHDLVLEAVDRHFGAKPKVGVYHSVGALAVLLAPGAGAGLTALVLFDPPIRKANVDRDAYDDAGAQLAEAARRRRAWYATMEEFTERARSAPNFERAAPGVVELLAETTLREDPEGEGYVLRCPSSYEAQILEYGRVFASVANLSSYRCPFMVIGADPTLPFSYLPTFDLHEMVEVDYDFLPEATHFLQLEQPEECVALMLAFLDQQGLL
ncbi:MAG: alpha/beta hydrolase [Gammaproteobacteria bacterium]|nr:alpha/beta hydrolase [Gammaproteobacteria bacterium]